jgi:hypothetical protein
MRRSHVSLFTLGAGASLALVLRAPAVFAFAEDICFPPDGGAPFNCSPLPPECQPVGTTSAPCLAAALAKFGGEELIGLNIGAKRSLVHADSLNLMAQAVGFSTDDANWISFYGEVPDYGQFEPTDMTGEPYGGGAYKTAQLNGFERTSFSTGGALFHYVSLYNGGAATPPANINGLQPDTQAPSTEYFIAHVRDWAMAGSGTSPPICAAGLTNVSANGDYATGTGCFALNGASAQIDWTWALIGGASQTHTFGSGLQVIDSNDGGDLLSSDFDTAVGNGAARVADARLGIYLHMLGDRVSHHSCTDTCAMAGPSTGDAGTWNESETSNIDCNQDYHALFHMWETGVDFSDLPSANLTTEAALDLIYDELVTFATARNTLRSGASDSTTKSALVNAIVTALQTQAADARIIALAQVACDGGYQPFPGSPTCSSLAGDGGTGEGGLPDGGAQDASVPDASVQDASVQDGGAASSGGGHGCSCSTVNGAPLASGGAGWLAVLAALVRRRTSGAARAARGRA